MFILKTNTKDLLKYLPDSKEIKLLKMYMNLAKADFALRLLNPEKESVIEEIDIPFALSSGLGSLYEALHEFSSIKKEARDTIMSSSIGITESMDFLCSKNVNSFYNKALRKIRNNLAFHSDAEYVVKYIQSAHKSGVFDLELLESHSESYTTFSLAQTLTAAWVVDILSESESSETYGEVGAFMIETLAHLSAVIYALAVEWLDTTSLVKVP